MEGVLAMWIVVHNASARILVRDAFVVCLSRKHTQLTKHTESWKVPGRNTRVSRKPHWKGPFSEWSDVRTVCRERERGRKRETQRHRDIN